MPEIIPPGTKEQKEEEKEEEAVLTLRPRGLRSRGPTILVEREPADQSAVVEGVERPEEVTERAKV